MLRPGVQVPSRKTLAGSILNATYEDLKQQITNQLTGTIACLSTDGWSNVVSEPIVTYMSSVEGTSFFLESVATGDQGHSGQWLADDMTRVIEAYPHIVFAGAVADNCSANKKSWEILSERFPHKFFYGCASHTLHLLVKDILSVSAADDPFENLQRLCEDVKDLIHLFFNHHNLRYVLSRMQRSQGLRELVRPAPTRWGSILGSLETTLSSEKLIYNIVSGRDFMNVSGKQKPARLAARALVQGTFVFFDTHSFACSDDQFVARLKKAIAIIKPIDALLVKYQSDRIAISEVDADFQWLKISYGALLAERQITRAEHAHLVDLVEARNDFLYSKAHGYANMLDPRFLGFDYDARKLKDLQAAFISQFSDSEETKQALYRELTDFTVRATLEKEANSFQYDQLSKSNKSILSYWLTDGREWPALRKIARNIFSLITSSASCERNFSCMGFIHSKLRNRLASATVDKLVYVRTNQAILDKLDRDDSDLESDVDV